MGDVALLSADIVGPGGHVLGIDRDATALDNARRRTDEQGCSSWVEFQASDLDEFAITDQFEALVGCYVLLYQPDRSSAASQSAHHLHGKPCMVRLSGNPEIPVWSITRNPRASVPASMPSGLAKRKYSWPSPSWACRVQTL